MYGKIKSHHCLVSARVRVLSDVVGPGMNSTQKFQLTQVHNTLRGTQLAELVSTMGWGGVQPTHLLSAAVPLNQCVRCMFSLPAVIYFSKMLYIGVLLMFQSWSGHLERWARYVVRCEIQYPGPIDTFTNFGKIDMVCLL